MINRKNRSFRAGFQVRNETLNLRVTTEEKSLIAAAAEARDLSITSYIVERCCVQPDPPLRNGGKNQRR